MTEECERYHAGPTDGAEPPLATGALIVVVRSHREGGPVFRSTADTAGEFDAEKS